MASQPDKKEKGFGGFALNVNENQRWVPRPGPSAACAAASSCTSEQTRTNLGECWELIETD